MVFLKCRAYGPHHKEQKIALVDRDGKTVRIDPETGEAYLGMYNQGFPDRCWSPDGQVVVFSTPCKSSLQSYALHLGNSKPSIYCLIYFEFNMYCLISGSQKITKLAVPEGCTGTVVLDVYEDLILAVGVCLTRPDQLYIGRIDFGRLGDGSLSWKRLSAPQDLHLSLSADLQNFKTPDGQEFEVFF